jgi:nucleoside-diphosphate-sugar epimerase
VTGATGCLGSTLVARLARDGHEVRALSRGTGVAGASSIVRADLGDRGAIVEAARDVDLAVHCAAAMSSDPDECRRVNIEGTRHVADGLLAGGRGALVHISTLSVYDDAAGPDYDEDSPLWTTPGDDYGSTKAEGERAVSSSAARGLPAVILRPTMILSMHERSRWGPLAIARARVATSCLVPFPELPYVHVDNLVDAVLLAARACTTSARAYNVVDGVGDTRDYLAAVHGAAGRPVLPVPADAPRLRFASERIRRELRWAPRDRWGAFLDELRQVPAT